MVLSLPEQLQKEFEQVASSLYAQDSATKALIEAIELWLAQSRKKLVQTESTINNQAFVRLRPELEKKYLGRWIVIAHGELQGVADTPEELLHLAPFAYHRIMTQIDPTRPKKVELGWQMTFA